MHATNEALAFFLEVVMLVALGWWGSRAGSTFASALLLGGGAPLCAAVLWGTFAAPKARVRLPMAGILVFKAAAFGCGAAAIYALDRPRLALGFAVIAELNTILATLDRDAAMRTRGAPRPGP